MTHTWMTAHSLGEVSRLDPEWGAEQFAPYVEYEGFEGFVFRDDDNPVETVGAMCWHQQTKAILELDRVVVQEGKRREGRGTAMVRHLIRCLRDDGQGPNEIMAIVNERDLADQMFLRACGLCYAGSLRSDSAGLYLVFRYVVTPAGSLWHPRNRIAGLI